jgi:hypothetical protein
MQYEKLAKEYIGRTNSDILNSNWPIQKYELRHPLTINRMELASILPPELDIEEVLKLTKMKQKHLAKIVDVDSLPVDRDPGYIGQIALFEALREFKFDTSFVVGHTEYEWDKSGFTLLHLLLRQLFINNELGYHDLDFISGLAKSKYGDQSDMRYEQLWLDRVVRNASRLNTRIETMRHDMLRKICEKLHTTHNWTDISTSQIRKLCGCSRNQAKNLKALLISTGVTRRFSISTKKLGLVRSYRKDLRNPQSNTSFLMKCRKVATNSLEYISFHLDFPSRIDCPHFDTTIRTSNISLFNDKVGKWSLRKPQMKKRDLTDFKRFHIYPDSPSTFPHNIRQRDVFIAAILTVLDSITINSMPCSLEKYISHYAKIEIEEVTKGLRAIRRKKIVLPVYDSRNLVSNFTYFLFLSQDSSKKIIPYISSIAESVPICQFHVNDDANALEGWSLIPSYIESDFIRLESDLQNTFDIDRELFVVELIRHYSSSALMSLVPYYHP